MVISKASKNNNQEYVNFFMLKYESMYDDIKYNIKNDKMFMPKIEELKISAMMPRMKAENMLKISGLMRSQKYMPI